MTFSEVLNRLTNVQGNENKATARCPAHEDRQNSLSVSFLDGKTLLHCHAGCDVEKIVAAMGLCMGDLFSEQKSPPAGVSGKREVAKTYDYQDEHGKLLFQAVRYTPKGFSQRRPDPNIQGNWIYNLQGITPVLYNLPAVIQAVIENKRIFICEGEKDCDALISKNIVATTNPMGAGKWREHYSQWLAGAYVHIIADNDEPGNKHAQAVAKSLHGKAKSIKICSLAKELPELPKGGDFSDFITILGADALVRFKKVLDNAVEYTGAPVAHEAPVAAVATVAPSQLETISALELYAKDLPPLREIIKGLLPQGLALLCAPSKYGKSWLALDMCLSVAAGVPFLGFQTEKTGVLYLALEDGHRRLKKRIGLILGDSPPPNGFDLAIKAGTVDNGLHEQVSAYLKVKPETGLIIIDVLQRVRSTSARGNNVYALDYADVGVLKNLADTHQICVLVVHHLRKMKDDADVFNMISGSSGIMGASDTIFVINKKTRESKEATLHITARDIEANDLIIEFDGTFLYKWRLVGTAEEQKARNARREYEGDPIIKTIKGLLTENPNGIQMTAGQFVAEMPNFSGDMVSATSAGMAFKKLSQELYRYDGIVYSPGDTKTRRHSFIKQGATSAKGATPATSAEGATADVPP